ncbi:MAG: MarR family transcriptional regulator [Treponema sp.]|nr:MarR family transcriptional regulator [Treponema sp.]HAK69102.1 transcriptional regulator [Treponema sp.]HBB42267.1 transcriptional regulator [Treponema sp.]
MEYTQSSIVSLISHLHTVTADFTNSRLPQKSRFVSSHGFILYILSQEPKMSKSKIAESINRDKSTTTVLLRKLIDEGLVKEEKDPEDSRSKLISLTAKGKKFNELTSSISEDLLSVCYKGFSASEKKSLLNLLTKMNSNVERALNKEKN